MGKASGTGQKNVVKPRIKHVAGEGLGVFSGGEADTQPTSVNACLFSLDLKVKLRSGDLIRFSKGDTVTLVRTATKTISIFVKNIPTVEYTGKIKEQLLECMSKGYVYSGKIEAVGANTFRAVVRGGVLGYASA